MFKGKFALRSLFYSMLNKSKGGIHLRKNIETKNVELFIKKSFSWKYEKENLAILIKSCGSIFC